VQRQEIKFECALSKREGVPKCQHVTGLQSPEGQGCQARGSKRSRSGQRRWHSGLALCARCSSSLCCPTTTAAGICQRHHPHPCCRHRTHSVVSTAAAVAFVLKCCSDSGALLWAGLAMRLDRALIWVVGTAPFCFTTHRAAISLWRMRRTLPNLTSRLRSPTPLRSM
jgi:hypothetical protein